MKLSQLFEAKKPKKLFHATTETFDKFEPRPTWFSYSEDIAKGWHEGGGHEGTKTLVCEYTGGKIASEKEVEKMAKKIWPDSDFLYSMFDERVGEFEEDEIKAFVKLFQDKGFDAAYHDDYDPRNFDAGSTVSFVVFRPDRDVKILSTHEFE